ncbi:MAG: sulfatase-like hydrolase/transferase [Rhodopirellula sp.]|nr:sulfatase-like hydrolase/transferase [Rhodopirellula sp.]
MKRPGHFPKNLLAGNLFALVAAILLFPSRADADSKRPNLLLLLADDMGYADASCFGGTAVPTPNLDALAASGIRMTQFYAASAVCTPTRASVLTGRYPLRFDIRQHFSDDESHLPRGVVTLPSLLQQAGYVTAHVGKWHLGGLHEAHFANRSQAIPGPHEQGFDHYLCQIEEQPLRGILGKNRRLYRDGGTCLVRDDRKLPPSDPCSTRHLTDINGDEAVRMIEEFHRQGRPFFINVWWLVPHMPYEPAPEPYWSQTAAAGISDDQHRFRSMVAHMDAKIGRILQTLQRLGIRQDTLILFTSDNGGAYEADVGRFKGGKTDLHEGGIRVPMIASWPARIPAGTASDLVGHTNDLLPTFCAAAGVAVPPAAHVDGINLLPLLTDGDELADRGPLFWQIDLYRSIQRHTPKPKPYATEAVRHGRWKLLSFQGDPVELFDIETDCEESNNLLDSHSEVAAGLRAALQAFLDAPRDRSGMPSGK